MEKYIIQNCYDSHTHFVATGFTNLGLRLQDLKSADDIKNKKIIPDFFQGQWLVGFGWDHHLWVDSSLPTKIILDQYFPDTPVFFSRVDGHASWINSCAIELLKKNNYNFDQDPLGGKIVRDLNGLPTGILLDQAHIQALVKLPAFSESQVSIQIKKSMELFNKAGFTHLRDLSMNSQTAELLNDLYKLNQQTICIDGFVTAEAVHDLDRAYSDLQSCKSIQNPFLRFLGLKIFVDGSLGSSTAFLSQPYVGTLNYGMTSWSANEIVSAIEYCWSRKIEIAIHVIGDAAADMVVHAARMVSGSGTLGKLNLEHVQLLRPETINMMKPLHIHCHMQPCYWLSDYKWLSSKIGNLSEYLFQWELLRKNKIPISFGSDSPIEPVSLIRNIEAVKKCELHGIPKLNANPLQFHAHPDCAWTDSKTVFDFEKIHEVHFNGKQII